jgi:hypothetical protein
MNQAIADPNGFEDSGAFGEDRAFNQFIDFNQPKERPPIGKTQAPSDRQLSHSIPELEEGPQGVK